MLMIAIRIQLLGLRKSMLKKIELINQKFKKLQASLKKQASMLGLYDIKDFNIQVEGGLSEKFSMFELPKFDSIGDPQAHLRFDLIAMKTTQVNKEQVTQFSSPYHLKRFHPFGTTI